MTNKQQRMLGDLCPRGRMACKNNDHMIRAYVIYKVYACSPFSKRCWAFGYNHQKSRHLQIPMCVLTCTPNIRVVD